MKDPWSVALGAALALIGTVLVQSWLVPRTQRRIRQRERWEKDVRELADLVAKSLPALLHDLRVALTEETNALVADKRARRDSSNAHDGVKQALGRTYDLKDDLHEQLEVMNVLVRRLRHLNSDAPDWSDLGTRADAVMAAWTAMRDYDGETDPSMVTSGVIQVRGQLAAVSYVVEELLRVNVPPKRPPVPRRVWQRLRKRRPAIRSSS